VLGCPEGSQYCLVQARYGLRCAVPSVAVDPELKRRLGQIASQEVKDVREQIGGRPIDIQHY